MLLPSVESWLDAVALRLVSGERLSLIAPPCYGKTALVDALAGRLGGSALRVDGRMFSDENLLDQTAGLKAEVERRVASVGSAQLLFDDYDRALRRHRGARLQALLYSLLVDGPMGRDIGALFVTRCSGLRHVDSAGSPLMSRVEWIPLPSLGPADTLPLGLDVADVERWFGTSSLHLSRALVDGRFEPMSLVQRERVQLAKLTEDLPPVSRQVITDSVTGLTVAELEPHEQSALVGLWNDGGPTLLADKLELPGQLRVPERGWPTTRREQVAAFANLISGQDRVMWVDRYLYANIAALRAFLEDLHAMQPGGRIILLGSGPNSSVDVSIEGVRSLAGIGNVTPRLMNRLDWDALHDRHMVRFDRDGGGWVLPTSGVIIGLHRSGSATVTHAHHFPIDYNNVLRRSSQA